MSIDAPGGLKTSHDPDPHDLAQVRPHTATHFAVVTDRY